MRLAAWRRGEVGMQGARGLHVHDQTRRCCMVSGVFLLGRLNPSTSHRSQLLMKRIIYLPFKVDVW